MNTTAHNAETWWVRLYLSGPIEVVKQVLRERCAKQGLCVTIESTCYLYTGGEEVGYVVGFVNYPRFPTTPEELETTASSVLLDLIEATHQRSGLMVTPERSVWVNREDITRR